MTYRFTPEDEKYVPIYDLNALGKGIIIDEIERAEWTKPCEEIRPLWEPAVMKDVNNPNPTFSWHNFLSTLTP